MPSLFPSRFSKHKQGVTLEHLFMSGYRGGTDRGCVNRGNAAHHQFLAVGESGSAGMVLCSPASYLQ